MNRLDSRIQNMREKKQTWSLTRDTETAGGFSLHGLELDIGHWFKRGVLVLGVLEQVRL
jgi:hypothetical protein